jgi:predicted transcriptional regulator
MAITLKPETEEKLRQTAQWEGQDADTFADTLLAESIARYEQEFEANVAAIQEGLDALDAGRFRPAAEFFAEHRQRYPDPEPGA